MFRSRFRPGNSAGRRPQAADFVVTGTVITADPERRVFLDGAVAVAGSKIVAVGPRAEVEAAYSPAGRLGGPGTWSSRG